MNTFDYKSTLDEVIRGVGYMITTWMEANSTKVYTGLVISSNTDGTWNVQYNGETHSMSSYGAIQPAVNMMVKVVVPQGNQNLAFFF